MFRVRNFMYLKATGLWRTKNDTTIQRLKPRHMQTCIDKEGKMRKNFAHNGSHQILMKESRTPSAHNKARPFETPADTAMWQAHHPFHSCIRTCNHITTTFQFTISFLFLFRRFHLGNSTSSKGKIAAQPKRQWLIIFSYQLHKLGQDYLRKETSPCASAHVINMENWNDNMLSSALVPSKPQIILCLLWFLLQRHFSFAHHDVGLHDDIFSGATSFAWRRRR